MFLLVIIFFILGYIFGSFPTGYFLVKAKKGIDIRDIGSGATGGTNVSRILGAKWGLIVGLLDVLKAFLPTILAKIFISPGWGLALVAISPVLGHIFPIFLQFKGGKGVSTTIGTLLALFGWKFLWILLFYAILYISVFRITSIFSLSFSSVLPLICYYFQQSTPFLFLGFFLMIIIWHAHRENISRIKSGEEAKKKVDLSQIKDFFKKCKKEN